MYSLVRIFAIGAFTLFMTSTAASAQATAQLTGRVADESGRSSLA